MEYNKYNKFVRQYVKSTIHKFRIKNWVEVNDGRDGICDKKNIKFKTTMLNASLCDYSDAYILVEGKITVVGQGGYAAGIAADINNKEVVYKNCAPFIKCISKINNAEVDNAEDLDIVMPMYSLLECGENYVKTSASLCQYYKDEPNDNIADSKSSIFKSSITDNTNNAGIANVKIVVPIKYLSKFWTTLRMPLINCEVTLDLIWSENCVICEANRAKTFAMTSAKFYVPVVTLSTQDNANLLQQLILFRMGLFGAVHGWEC